MVYIIITGDTLLFFDDMGTIKNMWGYMSRIYSTLGRYFKIGNYPLIYGCP